MLLGCIEDPRAPDCGEALAFWIEFSHIADT
jgi:hypothetical protein